MKRSWTGCKGSWISKRSNRSRAAAQFLRQHYQGLAEAVAGQGHAKPDSVKQLRRVIESHLPQVRIKRLLLEVNGLCGFTNQVRPLNDQVPKWGNALAVVTAAIIAHGTNLGIVAMSRSADGTTLEILRNASQWYLRPETLKAANRVLVDSQHRLPIRAVWGSGIRSSSDGQRFGVQEHSEIGAYYPKSRLG